LAARLRSPVVFAIEGVLIAATPVPPAVVLLAAERLSYTEFGFALSASVAASVLLLLCSWWYSRQPARARLSGVAAIFLMVLAIGPIVWDSPSGLLALFVVSVWALFQLFARGGPATEQKRLRSVGRAAERARWAGGAALLIGGADLLYGPSQDRGAVWLLSLSGLFAGGLAVRWVTRVPRPSWAWRHKTLLVVGLLGPLVGLIGGRAWIAAAAAGVALTVVVLTSSSSGIVRHVGKWWQPLADHPARLLLSTFFLLCVAGTALLSTPAATAATGRLPLVDAAFTSVSAVCVTGLIVRDTPVDFSFFGEACIALLIQFGGLGIMSIFAIAQNVLGRRLGLREERVLEAISDAAAGDAATSVRRVVGFTLAVESVGAALLLPLFLAAGDSLPVAAWRAVFTAISAFCNAGFALQSDSLMPYQNQPLVLHVIALLIVVGGLAPSVSQCVPAWLRGHRVPSGARLVLQTTVVLLLLGTFAFLAFEWNGMLAGMTLFQRLHNAWFQSVTLRTAGFNSVDLTSAGTPILAVMMVWMFIGGSPGGTAGGVKTTTIALLVATAWSVARGRQDVTAVGRWVRPALVYKAIAVVASGAVVWLLVILALAVTQDIAADSLAFEATSALATVGLSLGATSQLDQIGKVIVMTAMFLGRVGPVTLFMLLSDEPRPDSIRRPELQIPVG